MRLAIITTHPIQYNAPWFRLLAQRKPIISKVFYTWGQLEKGGKFDPGFGKNIAWDIPLLDGYDYCFVKNVATDPGSHHFKGIDNPTLVNEIESWYPDSILVFGWSFKSHLKVLRYYKGKKKILFRGDSNLLDEQPGAFLKKIARRIFLKWVYRHVDIALFVGTANKAYYLAHGLKSAQLVFAPHAIDNDRFMHRDLTEVSTIHGIPPDAFVFMFAGKMETKKDPQLLLDSFIRLNHVDTHLLMVGNGELETFLKTFAGKQAIAIRSRIHFIDFQNQFRMPDIYRTCNVFVLPSRGPGETWGLAVNEAMACSRAVLVSDKCGCAMDLVKAGINGATFKSGDGNSLREQMEMLLKERQEISTMGKRSLQIIQSWRFERICTVVETSLG